MLHSIENHAYIKPSKRLLPWLLVGVFLIALLFIGQWLWLTRVATGVETQLTLPAERAPLMVSLRAQKAIFWSLIVAGVALIMALLLAVSPLTWWMYLLAAFGWGNGAKLARIAVQQQAQQNAERQVAAQVALLQQAAQALPNPAAQGIQPPAQPGAAPVQPPGTQAPGTQPPGAPPPATQPAATRPPAQPGEQPPPASPPGTQPLPAQQPGAQPADGQPVPAVPPPAGAPAVAPPPGAPAPAVPPTQDLQALLEQEEALDLEDLTDIGDILGSFKENDEISPYLLALSNSLDDVDVTTLIGKSHQVVTNLATGKPR